MNTSQNTKYIRPTQAAHALSIPEAWLLREAKAGSIPHIKAGRHVRFSLDAIERALLRRTQAGDKG